MRHKTSHSLHGAVLFTALSSLAIGVPVAWCAPNLADAPLPLDAGRNVALYRGVSSSDMNLSGWDVGLTDGSWESNKDHTFATGILDVFPKSATVELKRVYPISLIRLGVPAFGSTKTVRVALSADGQKFTEVGSYVFSQSKEEAHLFSFKPVQARYIRVTYVDYYTQEVNFPPTYAFTTELEAYAPTDAAAQKEVASLPPVNLALKKPYEVSDPNTHNWGIGGLTNGSWQVTGTGAFATNEGQTFPKTATIDLGQVTPVGYVVLGVPPFGSTKTIQVSLSPDGQTYTEVGSYVFSQNKSENHLFSFPATSARFVRLTYPDHYDQQVNYAPTFMFTTEAEVYAPGEAPAVPAAQAVPPPAPPEFTDVASFKRGSDGLIERGFQQQHEAFLARGKQGPIGVLFIGDSITAGWRNVRSLWDTNFGTYNPANFGISGDRTQHVLWRIANGELDGIDPKVVVLMIGTNNIGSTAEEILKGDQKIVDEIHRKLPNTKLLLLGIFPRGADPKNPGVAGMREKIKTVSAGLAKLDDGNKTRFLDIGANFLDAEGNLPADVMPDALHPNQKGYVIWATAIQPLLTEMMK